MATKVQSTPLTFAQKLHGITLQGCQNVIRTMGKNPQMAALLGKAGKYTAVVPMGGKKFVECHAMNLINVVGGLTHGDYHPNVGRPHLESLGIKVKVTGLLPISAPERKADYEEFKAEKATAEAKAAKKNGKAKIAPIAKVTPKGKAPKSGRPVTNTLKDVSKRFKK